MMISPQDERRSGARRGCTGRRQDDTQITDVKIVAGWDISPETAEPEEK